MATNLFASWSGVLCSGFGEWVTEADCASCALGGSIGSGGVRSIGGEVLFVRCRSNPFDTSAHGMAPPAVQSKLGTRVTAVAAMGKDDQAPKSLARWRLVWSLSAWGAKAFCERFNDVECKPRSHECGEMGRHAAAGPRECRAVQILHGVQRSGDGFGGLEEACTWVVVRAGVGSCETWPLRPHASMLEFVGASVRVPVISSTQWHILFVEPLLGGGGARGLGAGHV